MTFVEFVEKRITLQPGEEIEPFCVFDGYNKTGYCDFACTKRCYDCSEAMFEYMKYVYKEPVKES